MFTKSSVSQALIDATKEIMEAADKKLLLEPSKKVVPAEKTPERMQAAISKKNDDVAAGKGRLADVRESDLEEGWEEMMQAARDRAKPQPNGGSGVKLGSRYGGGKQKEEPKEKEMKEEHEDAKEDEAQDKKIIKAMVKKSALKDDESKESKKDDESKEMSESRHMTDDEKSEREHIVKSMKKGLSGFKARYGNRAKNVMYATATKQAMKEEVVAEGKDEKIAQLKKDHDTAVHWSKNETSPQKREAARQKAEKIKRHLETQYKHVVEELKGKQTKLDKNHNGKLDAQDFEILRKQKNEDIGGISTMSEKKKEVKEEADKQYTHQVVHTKTGKVIGKYTSLKAAHSAADKKDSAYGAVAHRVVPLAMHEAQEAEDVRIEPEESMKTKTVDTLKGRTKVAADYHNKPLSYKLKLNVEGKGTDVDPVFVTNSVTPMKIAKDLAKKSFGKIRKETLGMASYTSEDKKDGE